MKYRRPGVNVGDTVRVKEKHVPAYAAVYDWLTQDDPLEVTFREAVTFNHSGPDDRGGYVLHLRAKGHEQIIVAKPSHVKIVREAEGLEKRP